MAIAMIKERKRIVCLIPLASVFYHQNRSFNKKSKSKKRSFKEDNQHERDNKCPAPGDGHTSLVASGTHSECLDRENLPLATTLHPDGTECSQLGARSRTLSSNSHHALVPTHISTVSNSSTPTSSTSSFLGLPLGIHRHTPTPLKQAGIPAYTTKSK